MPNVTPSFPGTPRQVQNKIPPRPIWHFVSVCHAQKDSIAVATDQVQAQAKTRNRFGHEFPMAMPQASGVLVCFAAQKNCSILHIQEPVFPFRVQKCRCARASARSVANQPRPQRKFRRGVDEGIGRSRSFRAISARAVTRSRDSIPPRGRWSVRGTITAHAWRKYKTRAETSRTRQ